jgi:hypothetical protein
MNMPTKNGNQIHQIIGEHPVASLSDLLKELQEKDFVLVEEFYRDNDAAGNGIYYSVGETAINHRFIGKIKVMSANNHANRPATARGNRTP